MESFKVLHEYMASMQSYVLIYGLDLSSVPVTTLPKEILGETQRCLNIVFPKMLQTIDKGAFASYQLYSLFLPEGLKTIQAEAFEELKLEHSGSRLVMPHSIIEVRAGAFMNSYIRNVAFSNSLTELPMTVLMGSAVERVILPNNSAFSKIGDEAFNNCSSLSQIYCYLQSPPKDR